MSIMMQFTGEPVVDCSKEGLSVACSEGKGAHMAGRKREQVKSLVALAVGLACMALLVGLGARSVCGQQPILELSKTVTTEGGTCPGVESLTVSEDDWVKYCYVVENTGSAAALNVCVRDDNGTPGSDSDDFGLCYTGLPGLVGLTDEDEDGQADDLAFSATATGEALRLLGTPGTVTNTARAEGQDETTLAWVLSVGNSAEVIVEDRIASLSLSKTVTTEGGTCPGVESLTVSEDDWVMYCYEVENTGTAAALNVCVRDDNGTPGSDSDDFGLCYTGLPGLVGLTDQDEDGQADDLAPIATATGEAFRLLGTPGTVTNTARAEGKDETTDEWVLSAGDSAEVIVTVQDSTPPNAPTVSTIADDNGSSNTDAKTNDNELIISGTAEANSTVEVSRDTVSIGTTPADGVGDWSLDYTGTLLSNGWYSFTATATDAAGNTSAVSSALNVLIDMQAPPPPGGPNPANNSYTNDDPLIFSWSAPIDPGGSGVRDYHIIVYDSAHAEAKNSYPTNTQYTPTTLADDTYTWKLATRDVAGNTGAWSSEESGEWTFVLDTEEPTCTVSAGTATIYGGDLVQEVTVDYSEEMTHVANAPTIAFTGTAGTWSSNGNGTWGTNFDQWTESFTITNAGEDVTATVMASGAEDLAGNTQVSNQTTFAVDTENPTITSITSTTPDGYYASGSINVSVSFSEPVTLVGGTLDVTLDTPGDVVGLAAFGQATSSFMTYTIGADDNSCDLDAIGVVLNSGTLRDTVGNDAVVGVPATTIADGSDIVVDTTDPVISGLDLPDTEQSVNDKCSITIHYSAIITDNCCINVGEGSSDFTVSVSIIGGPGTATLIAPAATLTNHGIDRVDVSGSFTISDVSGGDVIVQVSIDARDCAGNSPLVVSDTVTVGDSTIPVITGLDLPDADQSVDEFCSITIFYSATVTDNCCLAAGGVSVVVEFVDPFNTATLTALPALIVNSGGAIPNDIVSVSGSFTVSNLTGNPVQVQVRINGTDCCGNAATQLTDSVEIYDNTIPVINPIASDKTVECDGAGNVIELNTWLDSHGGASATDNCGGVTWTNDFTGLSDDCGETGSSTVMFTATDDCGLSSTTSATFTIEDTTPPSITTPASDETVECNGAGNIAELNAWLANNGGAVASDTCCGADVTWSNDFTNLSDDCGETGSALVTFTATDACGNFSITSATFTIADTTPPSIITPASDETVECDGVGNTAELNAWLANNGGAVASDTCCGAAVTWTNDYETGHFVPACGATGHVEVTFTATGCCGLSSTTQATFTIEDAMIPGINDLSFYTDDTYTTATNEYTVDGCCEETVYFAANVTDNCCIVPDNIAITVTLPTNNAILEKIVVNRVQNGQGRVDITGSADVRCLTSCPARVQVRIEATDCCGDAAIPVTSTATEGLVYDVTPPAPKDDPNGDEDRSTSDNLEVRLSDDGSHRLMVRQDTPVQIDVVANDTDNCSTCTCDKHLWIDKIVAGPKHGTATIEDAESVVSDPGTSIHYAPYHGYYGDDEFTYQVIDACGNTTDATVCIEVVAKTAMDDTHLTTCVGTAVSFDVTATDLWIDPDNPGAIPFVFSILTPPMHGVISGDLGAVTYATAPGGIGSAEIALIYTPATGFVGRDAITLQIADPFGGSSSAMVDIAVIECVGQPSPPPLFALQQGEIFSLIVPLTFASVYETAWDTVMLIAETDSAAYQGTLSAIWDASIGRYILTLEAASLPPGLYQMTIPLGNGETVTLMIEVSKAI